MFRASFLQLGGTVAIKEWKLYPPGSYYIDTTGEDPHGQLPGHNGCPLTPGANNDKCRPTPLASTCPQTFLDRRFLASRTQRFIN